MPRQKRGSTLRAQWLGHMLRRERERAGMTHRHAGKEIQRDGSTVSRIEAGVSPARTGDVLVLTRLYQTEATTRTVLEQLSREIWRIGWWETYAHDVADTFIDHAWLEDRAERIDWFEPTTVPGLFQTHDYATELITAADPDASPRQIEKWLGYRLARSRVLDKSEPPRIDAILDEAVVRRAVGGVPVMHDQLQHLVGLAKRSTIDIRIIRFGVGMHASPDGAFTVLRLPEPFPPVVHTQSPAGAVYLEHEQVKQLEAAHTRLGRVALDSQQSIALIEDILRSGFTT